MHAVVLCCQDIKLNKHSSMRAIDASGGRLVDRQVGNVTVRQKNKQGGRKTISGLLGYLVNWLSFKLSF